ncbi:MAG: aldo/keto reductase [Bacteroidaceae bacterium]|jgi:aryl-alcohol dehydrogenase-like predicted oxidoreductase
MQYREFGRSGLRVSAVRLGCMGMSHTYGATADKKEMTRLLAQAVDMGYTLFDTAESYGTQTDPHDNENLVGPALKPYRDKVVLTTKFGITMDRSVPWPWPVVADSSPVAIRRAVEGSLTRLQTDHIDLYIQHRIDPRVEPETVAEVMAELIKEGKILYWGISETNEEYLRRAHKVCPVAAVQNRYSMMARWHEALFPVFDELGVGLMAFSPLANGLLTECYNAQTQFDAQTDFRSTMPQFTAESFEKNRHLFALINHLADTHRATPAQVSLAWMLCKKPWIVPIPGTRKFARLQENAGAADVRFTTEEVNAIDEALDEMEISEVFGGLKVKG